MAATAEDLATQACVENALGAIFDEIARFCAGTDIPWPSIERAFRRRYVAVIAEQLQAQGLPVTPARLAVSCGVPRSVVEQDQDPEGRISAAMGASERMDQCAALLSTWNTDPAYTGPLSVPIELELESSDEREQRPTFARLVNEIAPSLSTAEALEYLLQWQCVEVRNGLVRMLKESVSYRDNRIATIERYGRNVSSLARTLRINRGTGTTKYWEAFMVSDFKLDMESHARLNQITADEGTKLLQVLDREQRGFPRSADRSDLRFGLGVFAFQLPGPGQFHSKSLPRFEDSDVLDLVTYRQARPSPETDESEHS